MEAEIGAAYADNARLAADPTIGLMASPGEHRRLRLSGGRYRLLDGRYNEAQVSLKIYF